MWSYTVALCRTLALAVLHTTLEIIIIQNLTQTNIEHMNYLISIKLLQLLRGTEGQKDNLMLT